MDLKKVIVMRTDTDPPMRKGKMIAQGAHSAEAFYETRIRDLMNKVRTPDQFMKDGEFDVLGYLGITPAAWEWLDLTHPKIALGVDSEVELLQIFQQAQAAGLEVHLVTDSGKTEFGGRLTHTCLCIGPDEREKIDQITGHLKLL